MRIRSEDNQLPEINNPQLSYRDKQNFLFRDDFPANLFGRILKSDTFAVKMRE